MPTVFTPHYGVGQEILMRSGSNEGSVESAEQDAAEYLVLLDESEPATSLAGLRQQGAVTQVASPRLVVFTADRTHAAGIESYPGVVGAFKGSLPADVIESLDDSEAIFAAAWALRHAGTSPKQRYGEGMSWDAPGFQPPDPPASATS